MKKKALIIVLLLVVAGAIGGYIMYNNWYNSTEHQAELASEMMTAKNYSDAVEVYDLLLTREADNMDFVNGRVDALIGARKFDEASLSLETLLAEDASNVANWTKLLTVSNEMNIDAPALGALYTRAFEASDDASFKAWIDEHQPIMPVFSLEDGDYANVDRVEITGDKFDYTVTLNGEETNTSLRNSGFDLKHGENVITVTKESAWGFSNTEVHTYNVNNIVEWESKELEAMFQKLYEKESFLYSELEEISEVVLIGTKLGVADKSGQKGYFVNSYNPAGTRYGNSDKNEMFTGLGNVKTSKDFANFKNLRILGVGNQPSGFAADLVALKDNRLEMVVIVNQHDVTQDIFETMTKDQDELGFIINYGTSITDVNFLKDHKKLYLAVISTNGTLTYDALEEREDVQVSFSRY